MSRPDVWQQLHEFQLGEPLTRLVEYLAGLPSKWEARTPVTLQSVIASTTAKVIEATTATSTTLPKADREMSSTESLQLFGLFASRYFICGLAAGFVISRVHVLVRRQRVRPVGGVARVALYAPVHILLLRAFVRACVALSSSGASVERWMEGPVNRVATMAQQQWGMGEVTAVQAVWESFFASCVFDCIDVFVARLEGSPCAPYEYIGGMIERMSLFYFYGASVRIHELALLGVAEKLLVSHVLATFPSGWQWRLLPTGAANLLVLHHFAFSMRHFSPQPQAMYPFVQVLSMTLVAMAMAIVAATVAVRWLASTVDRFGISSRQPRAQGQSPVAVYQDGEFRGTLDDADDEALYGLDQDTCLPLAPDLRRDFGVEILDLASTCLKQHSSHIRSSGFSRPIGAIRRPPTTALDEYVDSVMCRPMQTANAACGMAVYVEDEPSITDTIPASSMDMAAVLQDTRLDSIRNLSAGLWALLVALVLYVTKSKRGPLPASHQLARRQRQTAAEAKWQQTPEISWASSDSDSDEDYVATAANSDSDEDSVVDEAGCGGELADETAALVGEILGGAQSADSSDCLASAVAFIAHSYGGEEKAMTRAMYARHIAEQMPFACAETESLAALIRNKRLADGSANAGEDDGVFCVVCWKSPRCIMLRPCRCLCLCNECRAALALRDFDHCPCCRRTVVAYSRVYAV
ncbi:hypothetical protein GGI20_000466 [Coemansia sp. BCRC 34301]|nr:hypothetical protein GGI20_000466 [Coemansia sp. BCRC 34301]